LLTTADHLIGQPLALASQGYAEKSWQEFKHIPALQTERVSVVQGSIASIDCKNKVASIETSNGSRQLRYDYFVAATGLRRGFPSAPKAVNKSDFLVETGKHIQKIQLGDHGVVVIGGGAVGIEMAAELKLVHPERKVTLIHSRSQLLSSEDLPSQYKDRVLSMLQSTGVDVVLESRVTNTTELGSGVHEVELSDGTRLQAAQVITAISKPSPTSSYLPASSLDDEGRVKITSRYANCARYRQTSKADLIRLRFQAELPNSEYHYAAGDIAAWSGINRAGGAMHQGHHVAVNIHQHIRSLRQGCEGQYMELQPVEPVICVAIGKEAACSCPLPGVETGAEVMKLFFEDDLGFERRSSWPRRVYVLTVWQSAGSTCSLARLQYPRAKRRRKRQIAGLKYQWSATSRRRWLRLDSTVLWVRSSSSKGRRLFGSYN
jgi:NADH dehydrogenase FAD-containing subunit